MDMSELFEAFAPGLRHWREQRELQKVLVHRTDQGESGRVPPDLESGEIVIDLAPQATGAADAPSAVPAEDEVPPAELGPRS